MYLNMLQTVKGVRIQIPEIDHEQTLTICDIRLRIIYYSVVVIASPYRLAF